jgi:hypothetical protein
VCSPLCLYAGKVIVATPEAETVAVPSSVVPSYTSTVPASTASFGEVTWTDISPGSAPFFAAGTGCGDTDAAVAVATGSPVVSRPTISGSWSEARNGLAS